MDFYGISILEGLDVVELYGHEAWAQWYLAVNLQLAASVRVDTN